MQGPQCDGVSLQYTQAEVNKGGAGCRSPGCSAASAAAGVSADHTLSSLSLTQTSLLQLSSISIGVTQGEATSALPLADWLSSAPSSWSYYHITSPGVLCVWWEPLLALLLLQPSPPPQPTTPSVLPLTSTDNHFLFLSMDCIWG